MDDKVNPINYVRDLQGLFRTTSVIPVGAPNRLIDQVVIYASGATHRLYWYDTTNAQWRYVDAAVIASTSPSISPSVSPS